METRSVTELPKPHLFDLPPPLIASVIESLLFEEIVRLIDFIVLSNKKGRQLWHAQIKGTLRCPDMDNRMYSEESLLWVIERNFTIRNFTSTEEELRRGMTELHWACAGGKAWLVQACIEFNDDGVNATDEDGKMPLHFACLCADVDVVKLLLDSGAQSYRKDRNGKTPLHFACAHACVDVVKLLVESGAQSSLYHYDSNGEIPLDLAVMYDRVDTVALLLSYHKMDKKEDKIGNAFRSAARGHKLLIIMLILSHAHDLELIHSRDSDDGHTALHASCQYESESKNTAVLDYLIFLGADVDAVDNYDRTPLLYCTIYKLPKYVEVLLAAGAAVNCQDTDCDTPLDLAIHYGNVFDINYSHPEKTREMIDLLVAAGGQTVAQLNGSDSDDEDEDET